VVFLRNTMAVWGVMSCSFVYSTNISKKLKQTFPSLHTGLLLPIAMEKRIDIHYTG
jgi:hypothetical protein